MYVRMWFLLLLFALSKLNDAQSCYFSVQRTAIYETVERPSYSKVSGKCGEKFTKLIDLKDIPSSEDCLGARNMLDLVMARGAGVFRATEELRKWDNLHICDEHLKELGKEWSKLTYHHQPMADSKHFKNQPLCGFDKKRKLQVTKTGAVKGSSVTSDEAMANLYHNKFLLHIGVMVCPTHHQYLSELVHGQYKFKGDLYCAADDVAIDNTPDNTPMDTDDQSKGPLLLSQSSASSADSTLKDADYVPPPSEDPVQKAFKSFVVAAGVTRGTNPNEDFNEIIKDSKMRRVYTLRKLMEKMISLMAPDAEDELRELVFSSFSPAKKTEFLEAKYRSLLEGVARQYEKAGDRRERELVLASVALSIPFREIAPYVPGLSEWKFYKAKKFALMNTIPKKKTLRRERYAPVKVNYFVQFVTSPDITIGLPYGERRVKTSDGTVSTISNTLRLYRNEDIIRMFERYMKETGHEDELLSRSSMIRILDTCSATRRHALTCVDYFVAAGTNAFDDLEHMVTDLSKNGLLEAGVAKAVLLSLTRSRQYLRTDFKFHLKENSLISDHCLRHALSDDTNQAYKAAVDPTNKATNHAHSMMCPSCGNVLSSIDEVENILISVHKEMAKDDVWEKKLREMKLRAKDDRAAIFEMKKHIVRATHSHRERERIIRELKEGEALLTLDFAQKYLPRYSRETQSLYFGKRGLSYHVSHALVNISGEYVQHSFVHLLETTKQDGQSVIQIVEHVLEQLRKMDVKEVNVRSDNAGAYHGYGTIASMPAISKRTGVIVRTLSFSEAQAGKSSCDRVAAQVKRKLADYLDANNNVESLEEMYDGIHQAGLKGISVHLSEVTRPSGGEKKKKETITGIGELNHFEYEGDTIRSWKHYGIGDGYLHSRFEELNHGSPLSLKTKKNGGKTSADEFWLRYQKKEDVPEPNDVDNVDEDSPVSAESEEKEDLFFCSTCGSSFIRFYHFNQHILLGKHKIRPEAVTLTDYALHLYNATLEEMKVPTALQETPEVLEAIRAKPEASLKEGWALKSKRTWTKLSDEAKKFVEKRFKQGLVGKKMDASEIARQMVEDDSIIPANRMTASQIRSYLSKLCDENKKKTVSRARRYTEVDIPSEKGEDECSVSDFEDFVDEEVENIDDVGRDQFDVVREIVLEAKKKIFLDSDIPVMDADDQ